MTSEWLSLLQNAHHEIDRDVMDLMDIARVLRRVGSNELAEEVTEIAHNLMESSSDIGKSINFKLDADVKCATTMSGTILNGLVEKSKKE